MVGCADGDGVVQAGVVAVLGPPAAQSQPAHAVGHRDGRQAGGGLQPAHRVFNDGYGVVDGAEHGLQVHRQGGHTQGVQALQPRVPQAAVADKTVHQQHTTSTVHLRR